MTQPLPVNPRMLKWAREAAGLDLADAAVRAKIKSPRPGKDSPPPAPGQRLAAWENGLATPTLGQLEKLARAYRRPLVTFFLASPPLASGRVADFRALPHTDVSLEFQALKRRILVIHEELCAIAREEQAPELSFVGSITPAMDKGRLACQLKDFLGWERHGKFSSPRACFRELRRRIQEAGIYVILMGDLGSHHTRVGPESFRGMALADRRAPLIVVNKYDDDAAMVFSLIHELVHIWLGRSAVSSDAPGDGPAGDEAFCNAVAAEFLVPESEILKLWRQWGTDSIGELARRFCVSASAIARRLRDLRCIDQDSYIRLLAVYNSGRQRVRGAERGGGPSADVLTRYWLGHKLLAAFRNAAENGVITFQDAARALHLPHGRFARVSE